MKKMLRIAGAGLAVMIVALVLSACGSSSSHKQKKHYSRIYTSNNGYVYTRSYNENGFLIWYLLYLNTRPLMYNGSSLSSPTLAGASWQSTNSPSTSSLQQTDDVVPTTDSGEPTTDAVEDISEVPSGDDVTEDGTTDEEAKSEADSVSESDDESSDDHDESSGNSDESGGHDESSGGGDDDSPGGDSGGE